jgi:predicted CopG family antitoxin
MKTITIEDETWVKLTELKVTGGFDTFDDLLREKFLKNEKTDWTQ